MESIVVMALVLVLAVKVDVSDLGMRIIDLEGDIVLEVDKSDSEDKTCGFAISLSLSLHAYTNINLHHAYIYIYLWKRYMAAGLALG